MLLSFTGVKEGTRGRFFIIRHTRVTMVPLFCDDDENVRTPFGAREGSIIVFGDSPSHIVAVRHEVLCNDHRNLERFGHPGKKEVATNHTHTQKHKLTFAPQQAHSTFCTPLYLHSLLIHSFIHSIVTCIHIVVLTRTIDAAPFLVPSQSQKP